MSGAWRAALAALGVVALAACGNGSDSASTPKTTRNAETASSGSSAAAPESTGTTAAARADAAGDPCQPPPTVQGDAAAGVVVYQQYCNLCHGPDAPPMEPQPVDHTNCEYMRTLSDAHLFKVVCGGGAAVGKSPAMPAWRDIVPQSDIENLVAHLRSLCPA